MEAVQVTYVVSLPGEDGEPVSHVGCKRVLAAPMPPGHVEAIIAYGLRLRG